MPIFKHGYAKRTENHRLYRIWCNMRRRCRNKDYLFYGAKGISVCAEWDTSFSAFAEWSHSHGYLDCLTIDRIDTLGNYTPANCRWTDAKEQARNRRSTHLIPAFGETKSLPEWANDPRCVVNYDCLRSRICVLDYSPEKAITTPTLRKRNIDSQGVKADI